MKDLVPNTILLVEDEVLLAMDEQITLENYGYKVIITGTGEEAVEIVHSNPNIDLILMDINLGSGIEGTEAARQILAKYDLPLIFLSSHTEREIVEKTEGITSYGYIVKNSGETVLIASIKMAFRLFEAKMIEQEKETALRQSEEKYRSLFSQSVTGIYLHDLQGNIIDANQAACRQLGYSKEEILRMSVFDFHPETPDTPNMSKDEILKAWSQWQTGQRITLEAQHQRKDGKIFPVQITTGIVSQENEKLILAISQDITERKQAENSLKASEELFRKLVMTVPDLVLRTDTTGIITFVNEPAEPFRTFLQKDNVLGKNIFTFIAEKDRNLALKNAKLMFEKPLGVKEYRLTMNEDHDLICEVNGDVLWDDNHNPIGMVYVIRDISERKEMEKALKESEEKFRNLFYNHAAVKLILDPDNGNILEANLAAEKFYGWSIPELERMNISQINTLPPEQINQEMEKAIKKKKIHFEFKHRKADGTVVDVEVFSSKAIIKGKELLHSIIHDCTDRKKAEEALRESEERFKALHNASFGGIAIHDNGIILECNQGLADMTGYSLDELIGMNGLMLVTEKSRDYARSKIQSGYEKPYEATGLRKNGEEFPLRVEGRNVPYKGKQVRTVEFRDITQQKEMENRIRETQKELEGYFSSSLDLLCIANTSGEFIRLNPEWENLLGYSVKELEGKNFLDYVHPDDLELTLATISDLEKQNDVLNFINRYRCKDGSYRWIEWRSKPQGETIYAVARDITQRRKIEEELRSTKDFLENLLNYANAPIIVWDNNFKITRFNKAFERLSGLKESKVIGKNVELIFPLSTREKSLQYIRQASAGKRWEAVEIEIQNQNGEIFTLLWNSAVIYAPNSKSIIATITQGQDITERKRAEKNINTLLREKEMLLKETHHRIKNNMAVVKSLLNMQANEQNNPVCRNILQDAASRVQSMVVLYNKLYRSETYSELSIKEFLLPLIQEIMNLFRLESKVQTSIDIEDFILPAKTLSSLAIILNECITNSMKYAFKNVKQPTITVSVTRKGNLNKLIYSDNGCGIPDSAIQEGTNTFGLNLIKMLVGEIKGTIKIENDPGAKYTIEFKA